jgi:hypothetical protein
LRPAARAALVANAAAAVVLGAAWVGAAEAPGVPAQLGWLSIGVMAVAVAVAVDAGVVLDGRRALRERHLRLQRTLRGLDPTPEADDIEAPSGAEGRAGAGRVVLAVPGAARHHRPDCQLIDGKPVRDRRPDEDALRACGVCGG